MTMFFYILSGLGIALGLWDEFSERRRLGRMARDCKTICEVRQ